MRAEPRRRAGHKHALALQILDHADPRLVCAEGHREEHRVNRSDSSPCRHCEERSDEAIQEDVERDLLDLFAPLAMTADRLGDILSRLSHHHLRHQQPHKAQIGAEAGRLALARLLVGQAQQIGGVGRSPAAPCRPPARDRAPASRTANHDGRSKRAARLRPAPRRAAASRTPVPAQARSGRPRSRRHWAAHGCAVCRAP